MLLHAATFEVLSLRNLALTLTEGKRVRSTAALAMPELTLLTASVWSEKSLSEVLFTRWKVNSMALESGTARDGLSPGKVAGRRESGRQVLIRTADLWVGFLPGSGRDAGSSGGRMGICPVDFWNGCSRILYPMRVMSYEFCGGICGARAPVSEKW